VLVGLASHAGPDSTGAFPPVATLVRYTGLAEWTVRACLGRLAAGAHPRTVRPGHRRGPGQARRPPPEGWDLNLSLVRDDLDAAALEHRFSGLGARLAATAKPGADGPSDGAHAPRPAATSSEAVDNWAGGVQQLHPEPETGCNPPADGVQPVQSRGAAVAPEPYKEPSQEPAAPAREGPSAAGPGGGRGPVGEFFAALECDWRLTAAQRARLAPAVATALTAGWTPQRLAGATGGNVTEVWNSCAVLAARLSPAELPAPPARPARPPWCGECDQATRMLGFDGDAPRPCPRCKPAAINSRASP
jgi:hypothetical protein